MGETVDDMIEGACCEWCGVYFTGEHGYPVLCKGCWSKVKPKDRKNYQKAHLEEL